MFFKQFYLGCLAHASYLVGDRESKTATVVDPQRDVDQYIAEARRQGLALRHVVLTHFHADFVSGHLELKRRTGALIHLGARAKADYRFQPLADGQELRLGKVRLRALETPGHTPEGICLLVFDGRADKPRSVLTGDTLFIGDVGRPDLMASAGLSARWLAGRLYDSIHSKLLTLPEETLVYPAHGAGSLCGRNLSCETVSTIGAQKRFNYALKAMSRAAFIKLVVSDQPEAPGYFSHDAKLNRSRHLTLEQTLRRAVKPLSLPQVLRLRASGAQILDTRDPEAFAARHIAGSLNVGLRGKFATFAGILLNRAAPVVLVAQPGREGEAALRLGRIGLEQGVRGYLRGGIAAAEKSPGALASFPRLTPRQLRQDLKRSRPPRVLDVRSASERKQALIKGSLHIPLNQLQERLDEIPDDRRLVVHCAGGYRSAMAASLLLAQGRKEISDLEGGMAAWLK